MLRLIDSHCHLEPKDFVADGVDERPAVLDARARRRRRGLRRASARAARSTRCATPVALAEAHADVWAAVGIHPHDAAPRRPTVRSTRSSGSPRAIRASSRSARPGSTTTTTTRRATSSRRRFAPLHRARARAEQAGRLPHPRRARRRARDPAEERRGRARRRHPLLHRHARRRAGLRRARLLRRRSRGIVTYKTAQPLREAAAWAPPTGCSSRPTARTWRRSRCAESATSRPSSCTRPRSWRRCAACVSRSWRGSRPRTLARVFRLH